MGIYSSGSLVREVLEARLLAQQSPGYIAGKCKLDKLTIHYVESIDQVLQLALTKQPSPKATGSLAHTSRTRARERRPVARS